MTKIKKISVIIPCYNEQKVIEYTIKNTVSFLMANDFVYEICLIDDGSTDNTYKVMKSLKKAYPCIKVIHYDTNMGKGYAVRQGLLKSKHNVKVIIDADNSVRIDELRKINWKFIFHHDNIIIKGQRIQVKRQPPYRILLGKAFKFMVWLFTGLYMDTQAPMTILSLSHEFYQGLSIDGFAFDVEILYNAKINGYPIFFQEVAYHNNEDSSVRPKHYLQMFVELVKIKIKKN